MAWMTYRRLPTRFRMNCIQGQSLDDVEYPARLNQIVDQLGHGDGVELAEQVARRPSEAVGEVVADPAHPVVVVEKPRPARPLEEIEHFLPVAQEVEERGDEGPE